MRFTLDVVIAAVTAYSCLVTTATAFQLRQFATPPQQFAPTTRLTAIADLDGFASGLESAFVVVATTMDELPIPVLPSERTESVRTLSKATFKTASVAKASTTTVKATATAKTTLAAKTTVAAKTTTAVKTTVAAKTTAVVKTTVAAAATVAATVPAVEISTTPTVPVEISTPFVDNSFVSNVGDMVTEQTTKFVEAATKSSYGSMASTHKIDPVVEKTIAGIKSKLMIDGRFTDVDGMVVGSAPTAPDWSSLAADVTHAISNPSNEGLAPFFTKMHDQLHLMQSAQDFSNYEGLSEFYQAVERGGVTTYPSGVAVKTSMVDQVHTVQDQIAATSASVISHGDFMANAKSIIPVDKFNVVTLNLQNLLAKTNAGGSDISIDDIFTALNLKDLGSWYAGVTVGILLLASMYVTPPTTVASSAEAIEDAKEAKSAVKKTPPPASKPTGSPVVSRNFFSLQRKQNKQPATAMASAGTGVTDLQGMVADLTVAVEALSNEIKRMQTQKASTDGTIRTLQTSVSTLSGDVTTAQQSERKVQAKLNKTEIETNALRVKLTESVKEVVDLIEDNALLTESVIHSGGILPKPGQKTPPVSTIPAKKMERVVQALTPKPPSKSPLNAYFATAKESEVDWQNMNLANLKRRTVEEMALYLESLGMPTTNQDGKPLQKAELMEFVLAVIPA